jgi:hypothetical protein
LSDTVIKAILNFHIVETNTSFNTKLNLYLLTYYQTISHDVYSKYCDLFNRAAIYRYQPHIEFKEKEFYIDAYQIYIDIILRLNFVKDYSCRVLLISSESGLIKISGMDDIVIHESELILFLSLHRTRLNFTDISYITSEVSKAINEKRLSNASE